MKKSNPIRPIIFIFAFVALIPVAALVYWLAAPLFMDDEVNEALPDNIVFAQADTPTIQPADSGVADTAPADNQPANGEPAVSEPTDSPVANTVPTAPDPGSAATDEVTAVEIYRGQFRDADDFHQGSGDAILYRLSDGRHLVRFENFEVTNGPDLHVYLVPRANSLAVSIDGYVDLGELKGNIGDQNYFVDAGIVVGPEVSIVIWCEPFRVLFSTATLNPVG